jgi:predicted nucleotidyltransferase
MIAMKRDEVISKLRAHEAELRAAGIVRIAVFGSVARGDNSPDSDVDLLADFDNAKHYTLLTMGRLESRLADLLGTQVDLSSPEWLKESVKNKALSEAVLAFYRPPPAPPRHSGKHRPDQPVPSEYGFFGVPVRRENTSCRRTKDSDSY